MSSCRMFENKMKELEKELSQKTSSVSELKRQLKEAKEHEERAQTRVLHLEDQVQIDQAETWNRQGHHCIGIELKDSGGTAVFF